MKGKRFHIYGAFSTKAKAKRAESKHAGSFIVTRRIRSQKRFVVLKKRGDK